MEQIQILENIKNGVQYTIRFKFIIPVPVEFAPVENKDEVLNSWKIKYPAIDSLVDDHIIFLDSAQVNYTDSVEEIKTMLSEKFQYFKTVLTAIPIVAADEMIGEPFEPINLNP